MTTSFTRFTLALPFALAFAGCDASYSDLRSDSGVAMDAAPADNGAVADSGIGPDTGVAEDTGVGGAEDAGVAEDTGTPPVDAGMGGTGISGAFGGRGGYATTGTATIREAAGGGLEVVLSDDFSVDPGPGLEVVVSSVDNIGREDGPMDEKLPEGAFVVGFLPSVRGGATFPIPSENLAALPETQYVFIWCQPFDIEFARAVLSADN